MSVESKKLHDLLLSRYSYDPITGVFVRLYDYRNLPKGSRAGKLRSTGYRALRLKNIQYPEHRVAWFYCYGRWPRGWIDHINGDPADNRISNLREASVAQNHANARKQSRNTTGFKGVFKNKSPKKPWRAQIIVNRKAHFLGVFETKREAAEAYDIAARNFYGEFAKPNFEARP